MNVAFSRRAESLRQGGVFEQAHDCGGQRFGTFRFDQQAGFAVADQVRHAARACAHHRQAEEHRVGHRGAQPLEVRREREQVEAAQEGLDVLAVPDQVDAIVQIQFRDLAFQFGAQFALADDQALGGGEVFAHGGQGRDQGAVVLVVHQAPDGSDNGDIVGDAEFLPHFVPGDQEGETGGVHAAGDDENPVWRDAPVHQHVAHTVRDGEVAHARVEVLAA